MTDAEQDRGAVEWLALKVWAASKTGRGNRVQLVRDEAARVLALAREALEMRERGPVVWAAVDPSGHRPMHVYTYMDADQSAAMHANTNQIWGFNDVLVPLYAGTPEEVAE